MQPELRHLRVFLAVADQGSANLAGAALFRAQSAVSRSIHKLETELGVKLFERRARGMLLTEYGRALQVRVRRVQAEMQHARSDLAALAPGGSVRNAPIFGMLTHERRVRDKPQITGPSISRGRSWNSSRWSGSATARRTAPTTGGTRSTSSGSAIHAATSAPT